MTPVSGFKFQVFPMTPVSGFRSQVCFMTPPSGFRFPVFLRELRFQVLFPFDAGRSMFNVRRSGPFLTPVSGFRSQVFFDSALRFSP